VERFTGQKKFLRIEEERLKSMFPEILKEDWRIHKKA